MTRVNLGIEPAELCDQHLIAEVYELPRVFAFHGKVPGPFRLGKGHVLWCSQYPGLMAQRYRALVAEMDFRGFHVTHREPPSAAKPEDKARVLGAREIVSRRIVEKLEGMRRAPRWTKRQPPSWALVALDNRRIMGGKGAK